MDNADLEVEAEQLRQVALEAERQGTKNDNLAENLIAMAARLTDAGMLLAARQFENLAGRNRILRDTGQYLSSAAQLAVDHFERR